MVTDIVALDRLVKERVGSIRGRDLRVVLGTPSVTGNTSPLYGIVSFRRPLPDAFNS